MLIKLTWMNKVVPKPRTFLRVEYTNHPVNHATNPGNLTEVLVITQPDIKRIHSTNIEGNCWCPDREVI